MPANSHNGSGRLNQADIIDIALQRKLRLTRRPPDPDTPPEFAATSVNQQLYTRHDGRILSAQYNTWDKRFSYPGRRYVYFLELGHDGALRVLHIDEALAEMAEPVAKPVGVLSELGLAADGIALRNDFHRGHGCANVVSLEAYIRERAREGASDFEQVILQAELDALRENAKQVVKPVGADATKPIAEAEGSLHEVTVIAPVPRMEATIFKSDTYPLTKFIGLDDNGNIVKEEAPFMSSGAAMRAPFDSFDQLAAYINVCTSYMMLTPGRMRDDIPEKAVVTTVDKVNALQKASPDVRIIARSRNFMTFDEVPGILLCDCDLDGAPDEVRQRIKTVGYRNVLASIIPEVGETVSLQRLSTSAALSNIETGEQYKNSGGHHLYLGLEDFSDSPRILKVMHIIAWLAGLGWFRPSDSGIPLERSIIDTVVGQPERCLFEGDPVLDPRLKQDKEARRPEVTAGKVWKSRTKVLTPADMARYVALKSEAKEACKRDPNTIAIREAWLAEDIRKVIKANPNISKVKARKIAECHGKGVLMPEVELVFYDPKIGVKTVGEVLADPKKFAKQPLADPIRGVRRGAQRAMFLIHKDGRPWIKSYAYGGTNYTLVPDYAAAMAAIEQAIRRAKERDAREAAIAAASEDPDACIVHETEFVHVCDPYAIIYLPSMKAWDTRSVDAKLPKKMMPGPDGQPIRDSKGNIKFYPATIYLPKERSVNAMTWAPGKPLYVRDNIVAANAGWIEKKGATTLNLFIPPPEEPGDPKQATLWIEHWYKLYPDEAELLIAYCAHCLQFPGVKPNYGLLLISKYHGVGKDWLLLGLKRALGANWSEVYLHEVLGRNNDFLKAVLVHIKEARDIGEGGNIRLDRYGAYERLKGLTSWPPLTHRINEKYVREYFIINTNRTVITTNHDDAIALVEEDRRFQVSKSERTKAELGGDGYFAKLDAFIGEKGNGHVHVAAYLRQLNISKFNFRASAPVTKARALVVAAEFTAQDGELVDAIMALGHPAALSLSDVAHAAGSMANWLRDSRNGRMIANMLTRNGYTRVPNIRSPKNNYAWRIKERIFEGFNAKGARWKSAIIFVRNDIPEAQRLAAVKWRVDCPDNYPNFKDPVAPFAKKEG
jgi:hypothetical protein